jgi:hypothetical protein
MLKLLLSVILMLFYLFVSSLRSLFPSTKSSKQGTPVKSLTIPSTITVSQSYSTFSSPSIESNVSSSKRLSLESLFSNTRKTSKADIPLLSPASSQ